MKKLLANRPWILALILIFLVNFPAALAFSYATDKVNQKTEEVNQKTKEVDKTVVCIGNWADAVSDRSSAISSANDKLREANDLVLRAAFEGNRELVLQRLSEYIFASDEFKNVQKAYPVPRLVC